MKKIISVFLALIMLVTLAVPVSANNDLKVFESVTNGFSINEIQKSNGDLVWEVTEDGSSHKIEIFADTNEYFLIDGDKIYNSDIFESIDYTVEEYDVNISRAAANWVKIRTQNYSAQLQQKISDYTISVLAAAITSKFGLRASIASSVAATWISRKVSSKKMDLTRTVYGNTYALNHYKNVDKYHAGGVYINETWYNPPIY